MSESYQSHVSASTPALGGLIPICGVPGLLMSLYVRQRIINMCNIGNLNNRFSQTDNPGCWGGVGFTTCCCLTWQGAVFKSSKRSDSYFVCNSHEMECLHFSPTMKVSKQSLISTR
jgi:hypothetical protein